MMWVERIEIINRENLAVDCEREFKISMASEGDNNADFQNTFL